MAYAGVVLSRQKHTPHVGVGMTKGEIKNRAKKMKEDQTAKLEMVNALVETGIFIINWHPNFTTFETTININRSQYEEWLKKKHAEELKYKQDHLGRKKN